MNTPQTNYRHTRPNATECPHRTTPLRRLAALVLGLFATAISLVAQETTRYTLDGVIYTLDETDHTAIADELTVEKNEELENIYKKDQLYEYVVNLPATINVSGTDYEVITVSGDFVQANIIEFYHLPFYLASKDLTFEWQHVDGGEFGVNDGYAVKGGVLPTKYFSFFTDERNDWMLYRTFVLDDFCRYDYVDGHLELCDAALWRERLSVPTSLTIDGKTYPVTMSDYLDCIQYTNCIVYAEDVDNKLFDFNTYYDGVGATVVLPTEALRDELRTKYPLSQSPRLKIGYLYHDNGLGYAVFDEEHDAYAGYALLWDEVDGAKNYTLPEAVTIGDKSYQVRLRTFDGQFPLYGEYDLQLAATAATAYDGIEALTTAHDSVFADNFRFVAQWGSTGYDDLPRLSYLYTDTAEGITYRTDQDNRTAIAVGLTDAKAQEWMCQFISFGTMPTIPAFISLAGTDYEVVDATESFFDVLVATKTDVFASGTLTVTLKSKNLGYDITTVNYSTEELGVNLLNVPFQYVSFYNDGTHGWLNKLTYTSDYGTLTYKGDNAFSLTDIPTGRDRVFVPASLTIDETVYSVSVSESWDVADSSYGIVYIEDENSPFLWFYTESEDRAATIVLPTKEQRDVLRSSYWRDTYPNLAFGYLQEQDGLTYAIFDEGDYWGNAVLWGNTTEAESYTLPEVVKDTLGGGYQVRLRTFDGQFPLYGDYDLHLESTDATDYVGIEALTTAHDSVFADNFRFIAKGGSKGYANLPRLSYTLTVGKTGWRTGWFDTDVKIADTSQATAYYVSEAKDDVLTMVETSTLCADKGYIINSTIAEGSSSAVVYFEPVKSVDDALSDATNLLEPAPALGEFAAENSAYTLAIIGHDLVGSDVVGFALYEGKAIDTDKAYLPLSALATDASDEPKQTLRLDFGNGDDGTTAIGQTAQPAATDTPREAYTLTGQRVKVLTPGQFYIVDGKKVYVK